MHDPQRERSRCHLPHVLNDGIDGDPVQTIPIRTGFIDTLFTSRHFWAQDDTCS